NTLPYMGPVHANCWHPSYGETSGGIAGQLLCCGAKGRKNMSHTRDRHAVYYLALVKRELDDWRAISAEFPQIQRAWKTIAENDEKVLEFIWAMDQFPRTQNLWQEYIRWARRGLEAARALQRRSAEGVLLNNLGLVYAELGETQKALKCYQLALPIHE